MINRPIVERSGPLPDRWPSPVPRPASSGAHVRLATSNCKQRPQSLSGTNQSRNKTCAMRSGVAVWLAGAGALREAPVFVSQSLNGCVHRSHRGFPLVQPRSAGRDEYHHVPIRWRAERGDQLDLQSLAVQSVGVLIEASCFLRSSDLGHFGQSSFHRDVASTRR